MTPLVEPVLLGDIIGPVAAKIGLAPQPKVLPLQGYMGADGIRNP